MRRFCVGRFRRCGRSRCRVFSRLGSRHGIRSGGLGGGCGFGLCRRLSGLWCSRLSSLAQGRVLAAWVVNRCRLGDAFRLVHRRRFRNLCAGQRGSRQHQKSKRKTGNRGTGLHWVRPPARAAWPRALSTVLRLAAKARFAPGPLVRRPAHGWHECDLAPARVPTTAILLPAADLHD